MAKQLSVNEWKYLFEKYEKYRSGELTKKCFLNEMMKIKNVEHISDDYSLTKQKAPQVNLRRFLLPFVKIWVLN